MSTLTCLRTDLTWALKAVLPHVCRDKWLESLCGVRLEVAPAEHALYCVATDRYTIGVATVGVNCEDGHPVQVTVPSAEVRKLLRELPDRDKNASAVLDVDVCRVQLDAFRRFRVQEKAPDIEGMEAGWVKWREMLAPMLRYPAAPPGDEYGYDASFLARFGAAKSDSCGVTVLPVRSDKKGIDPGEGPSVTLVLADNFAGAIMARRGESNHVRLRHWQSLLPAGEKK